MTLMGESGNAGWMFIDGLSGNMLAWTEQAAEMSEWLAEVKRGDWGDVGVLHVDAQGFATERLWPAEAS